MGWPISENEGIITKAEISVIQVKTRLSLHNQSKSCTPPAPAWVWNPLYYRVMSMGYPYRLSQIKQVPEFPTMASLPRMKKILLLKPREKRSWSERVFVSCDNFPFAQITVTQWESLGNRNIIRFRYLGVKNVKKIHQNFLPCVLVYIYGVFLAFLAVSGRFQRVLVLLLFVIQFNLA